MYLFIYKYIYVNIKRIKRKKKHQLWKSKTNLVYSGFVIQLSSLKYRYFYNFILNIHHRSNEETQERYLSRNNNILLIDLPFIYLFTYLFIYLNIYIYLFYLSMCLFIQPVMKIMFCYSGIFFIEHLLGLVYM